MNTFSLKRYDPLAKIWVDIPNVAFPLSTGDYLDERLDECYVTFYDSTKHYTSTTVFKVILREGVNADGTGGTETVLYYVLDSDSSNEIKIGAGLYKHNLHLIEPTKLLEGVLCQTICFTNDLGSSFENIVTRSRPTYYEPTSGDIYSGYVNDYVKPYFENNIIPLNIREIYGRGESISFPSIKDISDALALSFNESKPEGYQNVYAAVDGFTAEGREYSPVLYVVWNEGPNVESRYEFHNYSEKITIPRGAIPNVTKTITAEYILTIDADSESTAHQFYTIKVSFNCRILENILGTKPYTITSMVNRCLLLAEPLYGYTYIPRFKFDGCTYSRFGVYTYSSGSQAEYYDRFFADEITLSNATLREQLKGIGKLIHAEPRVYVEEEDISGEIDLKYWVRYDKYGDIQEAEHMIGRPYVYKALSQSINEYCTSIRTNASNLVNSLDYAVGVVTEPMPFGTGNLADQGVKSLRSDSTGVRIQSGNAIAETSCPIYKVIRAECGVMDRSGTYYIPLTDITPFVVEQASYELMSSYGNEYPDAKAYAIFYTQGQPNLKGLFFKAATPNSMIDNLHNFYAISNILGIATGIPASEANRIIAQYGESSIVFRISYIPMYSTTLQHSKQLYVPGELPYSQIYNQSENIIEARYYGENVKGTAAKLGNVCEERTYMLSRRSDIPTIGQMIDGYSIAAVSASTFPGYTKCTIALSKDYNRINEYVGINSHKRVYEVSEREAYSRDVLIRENLVLSKNELNYVAGTVMKRPFQAVRNIIANTSDPVNQINNVITRIFALNGVGTSLTADVFSILSLPVVSAAFGNTMVFTWRYKDNYSAGQASVYKAADDVSGNWGIDIPYVDIHGRAKLIDFYLIDKSIITESVNNTPGDKYAYYTPNLMNVSQYNDVFGPAPLGSFMHLSSNTAYLIDKDSREVINTVNYEIEFRTTEPDLFIGSALAATNPLVSEAKEFRFYALKRPIDKFKRVLSIDDVHISWDTNDPMVITYNTPYEQDGRIIFPSSRLNFSCYWVLATELVKKTLGPYAGGETVTQWTGGEIALGGSNLVEPGEKIYSDIYVSVQK